jgi:hypothetical protein
LLFKSGTCNRMFWLRFELIRWMERRLSVRALYWALKPLASIHARFPLLKRKPQAVPLPDCLRTQSSACKAHPSRTLWHLTGKHLPEKISVHLQAYPEEYATGLVRRFSKPHGH